MAGDIEIKVREAGIVGAGGAGFPTHVKVASQVDTVIANGAECEPLLRCDKAVMRARGDRVLVGLKLLAQATGARRAVIALKGHYADVVEAVQQAAWRVFPEVEVFQLDNYYPAGDEQVLVTEVTGRVIPEGGIPLKVGVVVNNVITLAQIADAVESGRQVTRRVLTVAGEVARPVTLELPIGTPMGLALQLAGGVTVPSWAIVEGGPMMGRVVNDPEEPITKKTSGLIVLSTDHPLVLRKQVTNQREATLAHAMCCQCRMCTDLCPRFNLGHRIEPHLTMRSLLARGLVEPTPDHIHSAFLCCLCGVCEVMACPLHLSPRKVYEQLRADLFAAGEKNPLQRDDCAPHSFAKHRRVPVPRLTARLGLDGYARAPDVVDWSTAAVPAVRIPLSQHTGAPAAPVVAPGQQVREGDLIAEIPDGKLGARVHASISGRVSKVDPREICIEGS